jgi:hypothetical protein
VSGIISMAIFLRLALRFDTLLGRNGGDVDHDVGFKLATAAWISCAVSNIVLLFYVKAEKPASAVEKAVEAVAHAVSS